MKKENLEELAQSIEEKFNWLIQMSGDTVIRPTQNNIDEFNAVFMKWLEEGVVNNGNSKKYVKDEVKSLNIKLLTWDNFYNIYLYDNTNEGIFKKFIEGYCKDKKEIIKYNVSGQGLKDTITIDSYKIEYFSVKFCGSNTVELSQALDTLSMRKKAVKFEMDLLKKGGKR